MLRSNDAGKELILTARHVAPRAGKYAVRWKGGKYPARFVGACPDGDAALLETDLPGTVAKPLELSSETPQSAQILGYGQSRVLHEHRMRFVGKSEGDDLYTTAGNEGDSGAGVFAPDGSLCGVFVAYVNDGSHRSVVVSPRILCNFLASRNQLAQSGSGRTRLIIFPFIWFGRQWNNGSQPLPDPTPIVTNPITPNPPVVVQGPQGPQGPAGPAGAVPDLSGLIADVASLKTQMASVTTQLAQTATILNGLVPTVGQIKSAVQRPITVNGVGLDGQVVTAPVQLGGTLDVGMKSVSDRLSALEAKMNAPTPPTPTR